jgi:TolB protein
VSDVRRFESPCRQVAGGPCRSVIVFRRIGGITVLTTMTLALVSAGPNRYGHSDRVERHMFPAVSTGPQDPAWSPDGRWIAFSMRGDIWKVPADGGEATALTEGPAYHFEPAWSPDGQRIALSMDIDGNLDIGVVAATGGAVERLTTDRRVDVEPSWSRDGSTIYFVSARTGNFDIYTLRLADRREQPLVVMPRDQTFPVGAPDGSRIAFVSPVEGRLGTGGIWTMAPGQEPVLVTYEETEYRAKPAWTPDGQAILYSSDEPGSNDIAIVPASGGNPVYLTADAMNEYAPSVAPDGARFTFVSNRTGPTTLIVAPIGGGPHASWTEVDLSARQPRAASGRVRGRVVGPDGTPMPARVYSRAADGRAYAPDGGFHRVIAATETHYFHTSGQFELVVPAGMLALEALRGFEFAPASTTVTVPRGGVVDVTLRLQRIADMPARGWYSGDTHVHDLHQGRFGLSHQQFFEQLVAEDLRVTNALIHMDGTRLMGRWSDLTGKPHRLSTKEHILQYGEEFRGSLGHIAMIAISRYVLPFTAGNPNTAYAQPELDAKYIDDARAQGGIAGFVHPYNASSAQPSGYAGTLIPVDAALGKGDFYDIGALVSDEVASAEFYYRLLNCGFRIAATSGTDNFSDVWRDPPPGADRTYVKIRGPLSMASWIEGIKAGRTFGTTGPMLLMDVAGREPGDEVALDAQAPATLAVKADAVSIAKMDKLEIIANGRVVKTVHASGDGKAVSLTDSVDLPQGGWIAARVIGPVLAICQRQLRIRADESRLRRAWRATLHLAGRCRVPAGGRGRDLGARRRSAGALAHASRAREVQGRHRASARGVWQVGC